MTRVWSWMAIIGLAIVLWTPALTHDFVWDDSQFSKSDSLFLGSLPDVITTPQWEFLERQEAVRDVFRPHQPYRPLSNALYWVQIKLFGQSSWAMHAANLLFAMCFVLFSVLFYQRVFRSKAWSFAMGALLVAHPLLIEPVYYISAQADLVAGGFALLSTLLFFRFSETNGKLDAALSILTYLASLLSKETFFLLPIVQYVLARSGFGRVCISFFVSSFAVGVTYFTLHSFLIPGSDPRFLVGGLAIFPSALLEALRMVLLPFDLGISRDVTMERIPTGIFAMSAVLLGWVVTQTQSFKQVLCFLLWFGASFILASPTLFRTGVLSDRYLLLSTVGVIACAGLWLQQMSATETLRRPIKIALSLIVVLFATVSLMQGRTWKNEGRLFSHAYQMDAESPDALNKVAFVFEQNRDVISAKARLEEALARDPYHLPTLLYRGRIALDEHDWDTAIALSERGLLKDPYSPALLSNAIRAELQKARFAEACRHSRMLEVVVKANSQLRSFLDQRCGEIATQNEVNPPTAAALLLDPSSFWRYWVW